LIFFHLSHLPPARTIPAGTIPGSPPVHFRSQLLTSLPPKKPQISRVSSLLLTCSLRRNGPSGGSRHPAHLFFSLRIPNSAFRSSSASPLVHFRLQLLTSLPPRKPQISPVSSLLLTCSVAHFARQGDSLTLVPRRPSMRHPAASVCGVSFQPAHRLISKNQPSQSKTKPEQVGKPAPRGVGFPTCPRLQAPSPSSRSISDPPLHKFALCTPPFILGDQPAVGAHRPVHPSLFIPHSAFILFSHTICDFDKTCFGHPFQIWKTGKRTAHPSGKSQRFRSPKCVSRQNSDQNLQIICPA